MIHVINMLNVTTLMEVFSVHALKDTQETEHSV